MSYVLSGSCELACFCGTQFEVARLGFLHTLHVIVTIWPCRWAKRIRSKHRLALLEQAADAVYPMSNANMLESFTSLTTITHPTLPMCLLGFGAIPHATQ